jgi:host factor-I protein
MTQATETRISSPSAAHPTMQDVFLNHVRRSRVDVIIHLMDGRQFGARIKNFDKFAVVVESENGDHLIFKHAIASIESTQTIGNYLPSPQP